MSLQTLVQVLTDAALEREAYGKSYYRGQWYFEHGMVESLSEFGGKLTARVRGSELYQVRLWSEAGLAHECSCPVGADGLFCKHCVAAGLEWLARQADGEPLDEGEVESKPDRVTHNELRAYIEKQDRATLVDVLWRQVEQDPELAERLAMRAAVSRPGGPGKAYLRKVITDATRPHSGLYGRATTAFAEGIRNALEPVRALADSGRGTEALELAEYALGRVMKAMGNADDSNDGCMGDLLAEAQDLHAAACRAARPEPKALARRLFATAMDSDWNVFAHAAEVYADVLGPTGIAEYRRLAEGAWQRLPPLKPGRDKSDNEFVRRFTITAIMESLAKVSGDIEELVRVKARDLSGAFCFLEIAQVYQGAGLADKALEWAEKGLAAFPSETDSRLREFLFDEYLRRGRENEAMNLAWAEFTDDPTAEAYQELKKQAERVKQWPTWREEALEFLRERAAKEKKQKVGKQVREWGWCYSTHTEALVEILLAENAPDAAWDEARGAHLDAEVWLRLADERAKTKPADAVEVYKQQIERLMTGLEGKKYDEAVRHLLKVARLMKGMGKTDQFKAYLAEFRADYKRKRSLMGLLDSARWP